MRAIDVFTPGNLPVYTYYNREALGLEGMLLDAVETPGILASISGPSKSGKTVLCESVIGKEKMLKITGGGIRSVDEFWRRIRQAGRTPKSVSTKETTSKNNELGAKIESKVGFAGLFSGTAAIEGKTSRGEGGETASSYDEFNDGQLLSAIADAGLTLVIDDFHYIQKDVQRVIAETLKEAARQNLSIVIISVSHRSDETIRANPDLRGRVKSVDIPYWSTDELAQIAIKGFPLMNLEVEKDLIQALTRQSLTSPQLMQALCLEVCRAKGARNKLEEPLRILADERERDQVFRAASTMTDCKTAYHIIVTGPKPRGTGRTVYKFRQAARAKDGDIYVAILRALALDPPSLSIPYQDLKDRLEWLIPKDAPRGVGIVQALGQIAKSVERLGEDKVLDWDEAKEILEIPDPYFLYYLRWGADLWG